AAHGDAVSIGWIRSLPARVLFARADIPELDSVCLGSAFVADNSPTIGSKRDSLDRMAAAGSVDRNDLPAGRRFPDSQVAVKAAGRQPATVRAEHDAVDLDFVSAEAVQELAVSSVPDPSHLAGGSNPPPVGAVGHVVDHSSRAQDPQLGVM